METLKILILEDEIIIADLLKMYLERKGHEVVGIAISYEEAVQLFSEVEPDIALLDIRLSGSKTGIDFAHFINQQLHSIPFIFLTSQLDASSINEAKETFPAGYLSKPIQKESLFATIEIAFHSHLVNTHKAPSKQKTPAIALANGDKTFVTPISDILYLQAEHIYVQVHLDDVSKDKDRCILQRGSLRGLLDRLPEGQFIQTHRSFAVNVQQISHFDNEQIYIGNHAISVSRSRRKEVFSYLKMA